MDRLFWVDIVLYGQVLFNVGLIASALNLIEQSSRIFENAEFSSLIASEDF
jgi:hypothetical protein